MEGEPLHLTHPPNLNSSVKPEPTRLHPPGWQYHPCFLAEPPCPLQAPPHGSLPAHSPHMLPPTAEPRIRVNGSHGADKPLRVTAKVGEEVTLDCEAQGSPPPLITWTKDSRPVPPIMDR